MQNIDANALRAAVEQFDVDDQDSSPGFALSVCVDGEAVWSFSVGLANLEFNVPVSPQSVFHVASVSKQYTAVCVAMLIQQGKLNLQDDVRQYVPELPVYGDPIRLHHLIHHTSGLRDDLWLQDFAGWRDDAWVSGTDALDLIYRQQGLSFPTGTRFFYTNAGYSLLALIVERVSDTPFARFAREHLFEPLGMTSSRFTETTGEIFPNRATAYSKNEDGVLRTLSPEVGLNGAIGLLTTVEDFSKWFEFIESEIREGSKISELILQNGSLDSGEAVDYSLGFFTGDYQGHRMIRHGGSHGGYRSHMLYLLDEQIGIACFANGDDVSAGQICESVADVVLGLDIEPDAIPESAAAHSQFPLRPGVYFEEIWGAYMHIREWDDELVLVDLSPRSLQQTESGAYEADGRGMAARIHVAANTISTLNVYVGASHEPDIFTRVDFEPLRAGDLNAFQGKYWSEELGALYEITPLENETALRLTRRGHEPTALYPIGGDAFSIGFFSNQISLEFERDGDGTPVGFALSSIRTRNIQFRRVPDPN